MKRDLRHYARQTTTRLIVGGILLVLVVGDLLIYKLYGAASAIMGLICIGAGLIPIVLIYVFFWILDWIVKKYD